MRPREAKSALAVVRRAKLGDEQAGDSTRCGASAEQRRAAAATPSQSRRGAACMMRDMSASWCLQAPIPARWAVVWWL